MRFRRRINWLSLECNGRILGRSRVFGPPSERDRASGSCGRVSSLSAAGGGHLRGRDIGWSYQTEDCVSLMAIRRRAGSGFRREVRSSTGFKPDQGEAGWLERTVLRDPWNLVESTAGERRDKSRCQERRGPSRSLQVALARGGQGPRRSPQTVSGRRPVTRWSLTIIQ